jgi:hypothetical protein
MADSIAPNAGDIYLFDIADNGGSQDIRLVFFEPSDVTNNNSYRVFIVATANVATVDLALLAAAAYSVIPKTGANVEHIFTFPAGRVDVNGNTIVEDVQYQAVVQAYTTSGVSNFAISTATLTLGPETVHITLIGDSTMYMYVDEGAYSEQGATASDESEVSISGDVVDTETKGTYHVYYNTLGANEVTRTIYVVSRPTDFDYGFLMGLQLDGGEIEINGDYGVGDTITASNLQLEESGDYTIIS